MDGWLRSPLRWEIASIIVRGGLPSAAVPSPSRLRPLVLVDTLRSPIRWDSGYWQALKRRSTPGTPDDKFGPSAARGDLLLITPWAGATAPLDELEVLQAPY